MAKMKLDLTKISASKSADQRQRHIKFPDSRRKIRRVRRPIVSHYEFGMSRFQIVLTRISRSRDGPSDTFARDWFVAPHWYADLLLLETFEERDVVLAVGIHRLQARDPVDQHHQNNL